MVFKYMVPENGREGLGLEFCDEFWVANGQESLGEGLDFDPGHRESGLRTGLGTGQEIRAYPRMYMQVLALATFFLYLLHIQSNN